MQVPGFDKMMQPTLKALENLGGSGSNEEIAAEVIEIMGLPDQVTSVMHNPERSSSTEVEYRLAWVRTYLKKFGLIDNSSRGIWALTNKHNPESKIDPQQVIQFVYDSRTINKNSTKIGKSKPNNRQKHTSAKAAEIELAIDTAELENELEMSWKDSLHQALLVMEPSAFERLTQRLLRESGFVQVEVTGKTGDGGIDGKGIVRLQNVLSYHVVFQCKRYQGSVGSGEIRDFRGAMIGRADKGIFITTGTFTRSAVEEATRDGAPAIDLIDGETLAEMLKRLELGVKVRMVEKVEVDQDWFKGI